MPPNDHLKTEAACAPNLFGRLVMSWFGFHLIHLEILLSRAFRLSFQIEVHEILLFQYMLDCHGSLICFNLKYTSVRGNERSPVRLKSTNLTLKEYLCLIRIKAIIKKAVFYIINGTLTFFLKFVMSNLEIWQVIEDYPDIFDTTNQPAIEFHTLK